MKASLIICLIIIIFFAGWLYADEIDDLVPFIIQVESSGNPNAISEDGCIGLMQISPIVFKEWVLEYALEYDMGFRNRKIYYSLREILMDGERNKQVGTWYLHRLKDHYLKDNYTIERLLAAYNGGITRLRKVNYDISKMPKETQRYVQKILKLYRKRN